jgi:hypothetical protein
MHPYLSADIAAAHVADLLREAAARCCSVAVRHPVVDRFRAAARRAAAALRRSTAGTAPSCCPA